MDPNLPASESVHDNPGSGLQHRDVQEMRRQSERLYWKQVTGIDRGPPIMEAPIEPGTDAASSMRINVTTNAYGIGLADTQVYRYDFNCAGVIVRADSSQKSVELTKTAPDDIGKQKRQKQCRGLLQMVIKKYSSTFGGAPYNYWYDSQRILYSKNLLDVAEGVKKDFVLEEADLASEQLLAGFTRIIVSVSRVTKSFVIRCGDIKQYVSGDMDKLDHSLQQFLEIITSQHALNATDHIISFGANTAYLKNPKAHGFMGPPADLGEGKHIGIGASKAVRFIEGPGGRGKERAALVIDLKKSAFHTSNNRTLLQKLEHILGNRPVRPSDLPRVRSQLRGLTFEVRHGRKPRQYKVDNLSEEGARHKKFPLADGRETTVAEYFRQTYSVPLRNVDAPLVVVTRSGKSPTYFPLELCYVVEGQRVSNSQQTPVQVQKQIRECAVLPAVRQAQIANLVRGLVLTSDNIYHQSASLKISTAPLVAPARILRHPQIEYAQKTTITPDSMKATWRFGRQKPAFIFPATIESWSCFAFSNGRDRLTDEILEKFVQMFTQECRARGIRIAQCENYSFIQPSIDVLRSAMVTAKEAGCKFVFFITSSEIQDMHHPMKLFERELELTTQDLRSATAIDVVTKNKLLTLENVVNKTNMKNGGLNYTVRMPLVNGKDVLPPGRLVIGMATSQHKGPQEANLAESDTAVHTVPTVIGVAANVKADPLDFVGDCVYQAPRRNEKLGMLPTMLCSIFHSYMSTHNNTLPNELIIFRDGVSEGQYRDVMDIELTLARAVAQSFGKENGQEVKVTFIVVQKMHNLRLAPAQLDSSGRAPDQNVKPGTVIDESIVHPSYSEFYLNSHVTLQGSARTPRYTVVSDDLHLSADELQTLTYGLTFGHQIVNLTTSLPAPVYIAAAYAERGRNLYNASSTDYHRRGANGQGSNAGAGSDGSPASGPSGSSTSEGVLDYNRISNDLSYGNSAFRRTRVNA